MSESETGVREGILSEVSQEALAVLFTSCRKDRTDILQEALKTIKADLKEDQEGAGVQERYRDLISVLESSSGGSVLHVAGSMGHRDICRALLREGARVDVLGAACEANPESAVYENKLPVQVALDSCREVFTNELFERIARGDEDGVYEMLISSIDGREGDGTTKKDTPLHWCIHFNQVGVMKIFLKYYHSNGIDVFQIENNDKEKVMDCALKIGTKEIVDLLVEFQKQVDERTDSHSDFIGFHEIQDEETKEVSVEQHCINGDGNSDGNDDEENEVLENMNIGTVWPSPKLLQCGNEKILSLSKISILFRLLSVHPFAEDYIRKLVDYILSYFNIDFQFTSSPHVDDNSKEILLSLSILPSHLTPFPNSFSIDILQDSISIQSSDFRGLVYGLFSFFDILQHFQALDPDQDKIMLPRLRLMDRPDNFYRSIGIDMRHMVFINQSSSLSQFLIYLHRCRITSVFLRLPSPIKYNNSNNNSKYEDYIREDCVEEIKLALELLPKIGVELTLLIEINEEDADDLSDVINFLTPLFGSCSSSLLSSSSVNTTYSSTFSGTQSTTMSLYLDFISIALIPKDFILSDPFLLESWLSQLSQSLLPRPHSLLLPSSKLSVACLKRMQSLRPFLPFEINLYENLNMNDIADGTDHNSNNISNSSYILVDASTLINEPISFLNMFSNIIQKYQGKYISIQTYDIDNNEIVPFMPFISIILTSFLTGSLTWNSNDTIDFFSHLKDAEYDKNQQDLDVELSYSSHFLYHKFLLAYLHSSSLYSAISLPKHFWNEHPPPIPKVSHFFLNSLASFISNDSDLIHQVSNSLISPSLSLGKFISLFFNSSNHDTIDMNLFNDEVLAHCRRSIHNIHSNFTLYHVRDIHNSTNLKIKINHPYHLEFKLNKFVDIPRYHFLEKNIDYNNESEKDEISNPFSYFSFLFRPFTNNNNNSLNSPRKKRDNNETKENNKKKQKKRSVRKHSEFICLPIEYEFCLWTSLLRLATKFSNYVYQIISKEVKDGNIEDYLNSNSIDDLLPKVSLRIRSDLANNLVDIISDFAYIWFNKDIMSCYDNLENNVEGNHKRKTRWNETFNKEILTKFDSKSDENEFSDEEKNALIYFFSVPLKTIALLTNDLSLDFHDVFLSGLANTFIKKSSK